MPVALLLLLCGLEDEVEDYVDTVVITATRSEAVAFETPYSTESVVGETVRRRAYRTTPQVLADLPGVMVQETGPGQGSPYIRGFTGFRNLLLVDGVRLNNSVFRAGPNQYWNTLDPFSVSRYEVVKGPASVLYGSDAIGGTVNARTADPYGAGGRFRYRGATAENSHMFRAEASAGSGESTGALAGLTYKEFGDLVAGDPMGRQPGTGYDDWAGDLKIEHFPDPFTRLVALYQHVRQNNVPRTHSTVAAKSFHGTDVGTDLRRELDQERQLAYVQLHKEAMEGFVETARLNLSWQRQEEVRDRIRPPARRDRQGFDVDTFGFWAQLESETTVGRLTWGMDFYHDDVGSFSTSNPVQGPVADGARYELLGLFVQDLLELTDRWELTLGARFTWAEAAAKSVFMSATGLDEDWTALTGSVRAVYRLVPDRWNLFGGVSQGFRAPNLSDLTRLDSARSNEFEIPATGLDPEDYVQFELGVKGRPDPFDVRLSAFYTVVRDEIVRTPTGATTVDGETVVTKANAADGWIWGVELSGAYRLRERWTLFGNATYLDGRVEGEYRDRLMPLTGQVGVRYEREEPGIWAEALLLMADKADRLSARDAADTQRIPPGGTPGYGVLHVRGGWSPTERIVLQAGIENVLDRSYRIHGSGHNMPGPNFVFSLSVSW